MRLLVPSTLVASVRALGIGAPGRGCLRVMTMWQPEESGDDSGRAGHLVTQDAFWEVLGAEAPGFDEGFVKVRGEMLLSGSAFSATPVTDLGVRLQLGDVKKTLQVFGERFWSGSRASKPTTFTEMPITWERALGGPNDHKNYVGRGEVQDEEIGAVLLPNIELPERPVRGPRDRPPPAGFGPRPASSLPRRDWLGTMDQKWVDKRFPEMPSDFNPEFGQQACEDQWSKEYWRGDEEFSLINLHPERPHWHGKLPGLRARAWVRRVKQPDPHEVNLVLDTVWFFPRASAIVLIWRGLFDLHDDDELEVIDVMAALEWIGQRRSDDHYGSTREEFGPGRDFDLVPPELAPDPEPVPPAPEPEQVDVLADMKASLEESLAEVKEELAKQREALAEAGQPTEEIDEQIASLDADKMMDQMKRAAEEPQVPMSEQLSAELAKARADLVEAGADEDQLAQHDQLTAETMESLAKADAPLDRVGPPDLPTAEEQIDILEMLNNVKSQVEESTAGVDHEVEMFPPDIEAQLAVLDQPQFKTSLAQQEEDVRETYRSTAHYQRPCEPADAQKSAARRAEVERALSAGESLRRWDLTGVDLGGLDFRGTDLSGAWLESAVLTGANLAGCNLTRAVLTRADLGGADLTDADLTEANLGGVEASETDFTRAILAGAILDNAHFARSLLDETDLTSVDLSGTLLERVSFQHCKADKIVMSEADLSGCDFSGANLVAANFTECRLDRADFSGAKLEQTLFFGCQGEGVDFSGAEATNMRFGKGQHENDVSRFPRANFRDAKLDRACLGDTEMQEAEFRGSTAEKAVFSSSNLTGARFDAVRLVGARFERAILRGASFVAADLMDAHLMRARCGGTDFRHANLFKINTLRMRLDENTNLDGANLEGVRFFQPIREVYGAE